MDSQDDDWLTEYIQLTGSCILSCILMYGSIAYVLEQNKNYIRPSQQEVRQPLHQQKKETEDSFIRKDSRGIIYVNNTQDTYTKNFTNSNIRLL